MLRIVWGFSPWNKINEHLLFASHSFPSIPDFKIIDPVPLLIKAPPPTSKIILPAVWIIKSFEVVYVIFSFMCMSFAGIYINDDQSFDKYWVLKICIELSFHLYVLPQNYQ